jgi:hypothetical protein
LYEERAIRKQDTEDDTFDPFEDKDQSTPNHFNFWIAKYIKQLFSKFLSFFSFLSFVFFFLVSINNNNCNFQKKIDQISTRTWKWTKGQLKTTCNSNMEVADMENESKS